MKTFVWLSYDLGVRGDYESLYTFLDSKEARECGDSLAYFFFEYRKNILSELKQEISEKVELNSRSRIYVIFEEASGKTRARFLFGARKQAPWTGYASVGGTEADL